MRGGGETQKAFGTKRGAGGQEGNLEGNNCEPWSRVNRLVVLILKKGKKQDED